MDVEMPMTGSRDEVWAMRLNDHGEQVSITFTSPDGREVTGTADDWWQALGGARQQLEELGLVPCCNGARLDCCMSGMALSMARGGSIYRLRPGRHARSSDLVDTFAVAPPDSVGTIAEQRAWREEYMAYRGPLRRFVDRLLGRT